MGRAAIRPNGTHGVSSSSIPWTKRDNPLVASPHAGRVAFEECVTLLEDRLARLAGAGAIGAPGWVAFITRTGVRLAEPVATPVPTLAVWGTGMCLTPYVRALKQARPVVVVVADARKARIYRCVAGALTRAETIQAHAVADTPAHMGNPRRRMLRSSRGACGRFT
jgi:hypothetical protein